MDVPMIFAIAVIVNVVVFGIYIQANRRRWFSGMMSNSPSARIFLGKGDFGFVSSILGLAAFGAGLLFSIHPLFIGGFLASITGQLFTGYSVGLYRVGMADAITSLPGVWRVFLGFAIGLVAASLNIAWYFA
jgi:hypothetical protein